MDFYGFAATAIPVLWAACRIIQPPRVPHRWQTAGWLALKLLLIAGEIAGGDSLEGKLVEACEIELCEVGGLAKLAGVALVGGELAKVGQWLVVEQSDG